MMYRLVISPQADNEMMQIIEYIVERLKAPQAASDFADEVERVYGNLKSNPLLYERCREERLLKTGCRKALAKTHVIVYRIDETHKTVYILRIFHGKQDYAKLI